MSTAIHLCAEDDAGRIAPLLSAFRAEYGLKETDEAREVALAPLLAGSPYGAAYLLGPARAPVGYVVITFGWSLELGGMEAWLDEIYVRPGVRGRGIATEVLLALGRMLEGAGVKAIHLEADREDRTGQALYRKAGFGLRDRYCLMTRRL